MNPPPQLKKAKAVGVSNWFGFDWQYIVDLLRIPFVKEASAVIVAMPALVSVGWLDHLIGRDAPPSKWMTWVAALIYILFFVIGYLSCPRFIKEYRDFGEFLKRSHSNRFIGWEIDKVFNENNASELYDELEEKSLAKSTRVTEAQLMASDLDKRELNGVKIFGPNNYDVDLFTYYVKGGKVLELHLKDGTIDANDTTQRNLFWVAYTALAKSRTFWRVVTWTLFWLAVLAYLAALVWNVVRAIN